MTKLNGWIVVSDCEGKPVPVDHRFFMAKACAICLRNEMNIKKSLKPETYLYSYKIKKAILTLE